MSNTYLNNRQQGINRQYDPDGRAVHVNDYFEYDAAGRNNYLEISGPTLPTATMAYDGEGQQIKTIETWVDESFETQSETKYYLRSTVLGGQLLAEVDAWGQFARTFVYAGPAMLGWIWQSYGLDSVVWEQRDPTGASERGNGQQELDPFGADFGTFATAVEPTERAIMSYGTSHDPGNPNMTYSVDGIRMPLEDFIQHAGFILKDPLGLLEWMARKSAIPVGIRNRGVHWGERFEVIYDANGKIVSQRSAYDPSLAQTNYGDESPIYDPEGLPDPTLLPQSSGRVALTGKGLDTYKAAHKRLLELLGDKNSACAKYLAQKIGVSANRIARTVRAQRAFDAKASTISMENAGLLPKGTTTKGGIQSIMAVKDAFNLEAANAVQAHYARASTGASFNDVYFLPGGTSPTTILHEALHTLLGADDDKLMERHADVLSLANAGCNSTGQPLE